MRTKHSRSKLTRRQVDAFLRWCKKDPGGNRAAYARRLGVDRSTLFRIEKRKSWK